MFISPAFAQEVATQGAVAAAEANWTKAIIQFALILGVLYFLLIRPQQKRIKQHETALKAIIKGVQIIVGGMEATVTEVIDDEKVKAEIAPGVVVTVVRAHISQVIFPQLEKKK